MASSCNNTVVILSEDDIVGASLSGRKPEELKNSELLFWLKCRGDNCKGLKTKAQLVKRVNEYIETGRDKVIVDPDPNQVYTRRKEKEVSLDKPEKDNSTPKQCVKFPSEWTTNLESMPMFTRAHMDSHIKNSGKTIANKNSHSIPTGLRKAKTFLEDEYLEEILCNSDQRYFYAKAKCCHSYRKNDPPHDLKLAICAISGDVECANCSCVAGKVGYCNHILALMFKLCKYSLYGCKSTEDLSYEADQQASLACTSKPQQWHKKGGGAKIAPEPVSEVIVTRTKLDENRSRSGVKSLLYVARAKASHNYQAEHTLKDKLSKINCNIGFAQMVYDTNNPVSTVETKFGKCQVGSMLSYQASFTESNFEARADIDAVQRLLVPNEPHELAYPRFPLCANNSLMDVPNNLSEKEMALINSLKMSEDQINNIERETRKQSESEKWKNARKYRFTASRFHAVSVRQRNHENFAKTQMNPPSLGSVAAIAHGRKFESTALVQYHKYMFSRKTPVQVLPSGFVIMNDFEILGASPDARVVDPGCSDHYGIAEVKCPHKHFQVTPLEASKDSTFFMEQRSDTKCSLKRSHLYFYQVQGQMGVTGAKWCDFIVYTNVGLYIQRIPFLFPILG